MSQSYLSVRWAAQWFGVCLLLVSVGCSLDFDQFEVDGRGNSNNANNKPDGGDDVGNDTGSDMDLTDMADMPADTLPPNLPIGSACSADTDCGDEKICVDGYCTLDCSATACPDGSLCIDWAGEQRCAAACDAGCEIEARMDLACVLAITPNGGRAQACLSDEDGDATSDIMDNCAGLANPGQADFDVDGQGDACDVDVACFAGAEATGVLSLGAFPYALTQPSYPSYTTQTVIPFFGGLDAAGETSDAAWWLDLSAGTFEEGSPLPYPGVGFAIAHRSNGFTLSPGAQAPGGTQQDGRMITIDVRGTEFEQSFQRTVSEPTFLRTSDGALWMHSFDDSVGRVWRIYKYSDETQIFVQHIAGQGNRRKWYASVSGNGTGFFYSQGRNIAQISTVITVTPGRGAQSRDYDLPDVSDPFDPLILPGTGGMGWVIERQTGMTWVLDFQSGDVTRAPNLDFTSTATERHYIAMSNGPGFVLVSRESADSPNVDVNVYALPCFPDAGSLNRDGDTLGDIVDNCPLVDNETQTDLDLDFWGDACDPDLDGDEIANSDDFVLDAQGVMLDQSADSDNDGIANDTDTDDDGDNIEDTLDRFPIDSRNNHVLNAYDLDDDGDGYADSREWAGRTGHDPLKIQNGGWVAFVRDTGNGRTVEIANFNEMREATQPLALNGSPYLPRMWAGGSQVLALNGAPEVATSVFWADRLTGMNTEYEVGGPIRGADPRAVGPVNDLLEFVVTNQRVGETDWEISLATLTPTVALAPIYSGLPNIGAPDVFGAVSVFAGSQNGCTDCTDVWQVQSGSAQRVTFDVQNPSLARRQLGVFTVVGDSADGGRTAFVTNGVLEALRPESASTVNSVVAMGEGNFLVSAKDETGTFNLWFYNRRLAQWFRVLESADNLIEIDWIL